MSGRWWITVCLAALVGGAGAAIALAGTGDIDWQGTTTNLPADAQETLKVECASDRAIGGGGGFGASIDRRGEMASSAPFDDNDGNSAPDDGWLITAHVQGPGAENKSFRVDVICTARGDLSYRSERVPLPDREKPTAHKIACPGGTSVTGGGANVKEPTLDSEFAASSPYDDGDPGQAPDDGWRVVLTNFNQAGADTRMRVFAICANQGQYTYEQGQILVNPSLQNQVSKDCPNGQAAVGGGGSVSRPRFFTELIGTEPTGGGPSGPFDAWEAAANNDSPDENRTLTTWVICRG